MTSPATLVRRLRRDNSGMAMIEFAFTLPIVLGIGGYGIEVANLALMNLQASQIALALADNASRVGATSALSTQQLREVDVNDVLRAAQLQGEKMELTTRGRITVSSLENIKQSYDPDTAVQRIHWQRCIGQKNGADYTSHYGTALTTDGSDATAANKGTAMPTGMGGTNKVNAPVNSGVIFVELNYETKPVFGSMLMSPARIHYVASFIVRDNRDFKQMFNLAAPNAATPSTCNLFTKGPGNTNV